MSKRLPMICTALLLAPLPISLGPVADGGFAALIGCAYADSGPDRKAEAHLGDDRNEDDRQDPEQRLGASANLHLRYANGWSEQILDGRYRLVDPSGRTVSDRWATTTDVTRMRAAAGQ